MSTAIAVPDKGMVEQAFELALPVPSVGDSFHEELEGLIEARKTLLPVEAGATFRLTAKIDEMRTELRRSSYAEPQLPLDPLGWRWKNGLPKLVLLAVGSGPVFSIHASRGRFGTAHEITALPSLLARQYDDVCKLAVSHCVRRESSKTFSFTFDGVIPMPVRRRMSEAMASRRFENLYLLVEAPEKAWVVEQVKGISRRQEAQEWASQIDPLVLGWAEQSLWVIDKFDLTTLEEYVVDEFTQKALPSGS